MSSFAEFQIIGLMTLICQEAYIAVLGACLQPVSILIIGLMANTFVMGVLLNLNEILFFKYLKEIVFRRQLAFNDDFVGVWIKISNLVVSLCLAGVQAHGSNFTRSFIHPHLPYFWTYPTIRYDIDTIYNIHSIHVKIHILNSKYFQDSIGSRYHHNSTEHYIINALSFQVLQKKESSHTNQFAKCSKCSYLDEQPSLQC